MGASPAWSAAPASSAFAWRPVGARASAPWRAKLMVLVRLQVDTLHRCTPALLLDPRVIQRSKAWRIGGSWTPVVRAT